MRGRDFWRTVAGLPRPRDRKNVRRVPATVLEVSGAAPTQQARVLLPGEEATERPFFPVRGLVAVGESCFAEVNASGLVVVGNAGAGSGGGTGVTDHGALTGLSDDDHPQYVTHQEAQGDPTGFADVSGEGGTNLALADNAPRKVPVANVAADAAGWFADGAYKPRVAGNYAFTFMVPVSGLADQTRVLIRLYKNGSFFSTLVNLPMSGPGSMNLNASFATPANGTTDFFEMYVLTVGGTGTLVMGAGTRFQAYRLPASGP